MLLHLYVRKILVARLIGIHKPQCLSAPRDLQSSKACWVAALCDIPKREKTVELSPGSAAPWLYDPGYVPLDLTLFPY